MDTTNLMQCLVVDIADAPLDLISAFDFVSDPAFGGIDIFVGRVRTFNQGRDVTGIHYDMFDPLALAVFAKSAEKAISQYGPKIKIHVSHAKGRLGIGDLAVIVAVGTPHRDQAFRACRDVIEAVKHESPIWKQEHYVDGSSEWSEGCSLCVDETTVIQAHKHADDMPCCKHDDAKCGEALHEDAN